MKILFDRSDRTNGARDRRAALDRVHKVTAFAASPKSIALKNERLRILKGNATTKANFLRRCRS